MAIVFPFKFSSLSLRRSCISNTRRASILEENLNLKDNRAKIGYKTVLASLVVLFFLLPVSVFAAPQPAVKPVQASVIAIVDVPRILKEAKSAQTIRKQIETHRKKFQTQIAQEETELRKAEKELIELREEGKKEAFVEMEQKLQARFMKVERYVQARRKALDKAYTEAMNTVRKNLVATVAKLAKARSVNLVVVKQQVIWNAEAIDLTEEVLKSLDKALPQIIIEMAAEDALNSQKPFVIKR